MRKQVFSSFVEALDWDEDKGVLTVEYQNGGKSMFPATEEQAMAVWNAPSIGSALHANIPGFTHKNVPRDASGG